MGHDQATSDGSHARGASAYVLSLRDELAERHPAARSTATGQTVMLSNAILMLDDLTVGHEGEAAAPIVETGPSA